MKAIVDPNIAEIFGPPEIRTYACPCGCGRRRTRAQLHGERERDREETIEWSWHHEQALAWIWAHPCTPIQDAAQDRRQAWLRAQSHGDLTLFGVATRHTIARGRVVYQITDDGRSFLRADTPLPRSIVVRGRGRGQARELVSESDEIVRCGEVCDPIPDARLLRELGRPAVEGVLR